MNDAPSPTPENESNGLNKQNAPEGVNPPEEARENASRKPRKSAFDSPWSQDEPAELSAAQSPEGQAVEKSPAEILDARKDDALAAFAANYGSKKILPEPPRLRIHHIMLLTLVVAVLLTLVTAMGENLAIVGGRRFEKAESAIDFNKIKAALQITLWAVPLTVLLLGIYWQIKGLRFFDQMGHWMALIEASTAAVMFGMILTFLVYGNQSPLAGGWMALFGILYLIRSVAVFFLYFWLSRRVADTNKWKRFCRAAAWLMPLPFLLGMLIGILFFRAGPKTVVLYSVLVSMVPIVIYLIYLLLAAREDWKQKTPRHWSHWVVVGTIAIQATSQVGMYLFYWIANMVK